MSSICILQYTTDTPQSHQYLIYSLETKYKYQISPSKCGNICLQDLVKTRLVTTRWHEAGRREAARQPTLLIRDPNISDSATMCGEHRQHSLPPPPRPFVTQAVGHSIYSLYSLYLQLVSVCPGSGVGLLGPYLCGGAEGGRGLQLDWATFTFTCCCWHQMAARSQDGTLDA